MARQASSLVGTLTTHTSRARQACSLVGTPSFGLGGGAVASSRASLPYLLNTALSSPPSAIKKPKKQPTYLHFSISFSLHFSSTFFTFSLYSLFFTIFITINIILIIFLIIIIIIIIIIFSFYFSSISLKMLFLFPTTFSSGANRVPTRTPLLLK